MRSVLFVVFVSVLTVFATDAFAARMESLNIIYYDANNNVIGQHAEYCNNVQVEGGVADWNNPYALTIVGGCGDPIYNCGWVGSGDNQRYECNGSGDYYYGVSVSYQSATGRSIEAACQDVVNACSSNEPILATGRGFNFVQIYP